MADELGPRGIRVNGLLPGRIATDRIRRLDARSGDPDEAQARRRPAPSRCGATGTPTEFGKVAAFMLSPAAVVHDRRDDPVDGARAI